MWNARKDTTWLAARTRLRPFDGLHFYDAYLWRSHVAMLTQARGRKMGVKTAAYVCHFPERELLVDGAWVKVPFPPKAGEVHFSVGRWDLGIVSHEVSHVAIGLARAYRLDPACVFGGAMDASADRHLLPEALRGDADEEAYAYLHGRLVETAYNWLWRVDPPGPGRRRRGGDGGCTCQGCGRRYRVDLLVPDELWERVKPEGKPEGAGLLCGRCIMDRVEAIGAYGHLRACGAIAG